MRSTWSLSFHVKVIVCGVKVIVCGVKVIVPELVEMVEMSVGSVIELLLGICDGVPVYRILLGH